MWAAPILNEKTFHLEYAPFFFCNRQKYNQNVKKAIESPADGQRNTKKSLLDAIGSRPVKFYLKLPALGFLQNEKPT